MSSAEHLSRYFTGKKALVTGGSSGIGKSLAQGLLRHGAEVVIVSDNGEALRTALEELRAAGNAVSSYRCDLAESGQIERLARSIVDERGVPDILINNAGFATYRTFEQTPLEEVERLLKVNLLGAMLLTRHLLPGFIQRRSGAIVNMSSIAGTIPMTPCGTYSAAKHGMVAWSETMLSELARFDIHVNVICPGRVETPFFSHETFRRRAARPETKLTLPMSVVVEETLKAIAANRFLTYVPRTLGWLSWLRAAFPFAVNPVLRWLMRARVESLYTIK